MKPRELKKLFNEGFLNEEQYKDELFKIATKKPETKSKRIYEGVTREEFIKLMKVTRKETHRLAFILAFGGGLRISEIVGGKREDGTQIPALKPEDINLKTKKIHIRFAKGKKDRITVVPKWFKEKHLKLLPLKMTERALDASFQRNSAKAGINRVIAYFDRKGKSIPIYRLKFHSLRRGFGTTLMENGVPPNQVQLLLGHESLSTTTDYVRANPQDAIQSAVEAWDKNIV